MPPKKRTTKTDAPATPTTPASATPAVTPAASLSAKKPAVEAKAKVAAKPAAKAPAAKRTKSAAVAEAAMIEVPVVADAAATPVQRVVTDDDIRRHAYLISQTRKGPGDPIADWFEAERQLRG